MCWWSVYSSCMWIMENILIYSQFIHPVVLTPGKVMSVLSVSPTRMMSFSYLADISLSVDIAYVWSSNVHFAEDLLQITFGREIIKLKMRVPLLKAFTSWFLEYSCFLYPVSSILFLFLLLQISIPHYLFSLRICKLQSTLSIINSLKEMEVCIRAAGKMCKSLGKSIDAMGVKMEGRFTAIEERMS